MSRKAHVPASTSYREGKRGRHKRAVSPETRRWEDEHLIPEKPPWMSDHLYRSLAQMRNEL
jgi:hypothetical protein